MLFLNRAKAVCVLVGVLCFAGSMFVKRSPMVASAFTVTEAGASETDEAEACIRCHKEEVNGFARSKMAHSMQLPAHEPEGTVRAPQATLRMYSNQSGIWQSLESHGHAENYRVDYVIGSGTHASGYIVSLS